MQMIWRLIFLLLLLSSCGGIQGDPHALVGTRWKLQSIASVFAFGRDGRYAETKSDGTPGWAGTYTQVDNLLTMVIENVSTSVNKAYCTMAWTDNDTFACDIDLSDKWKRVP